MGFLLPLVCIGTPRSTFDCNRLKLFTSYIIRETFKNDTKGGLNLTCCYGHKQFMFSSSSDVGHKCAEFYLILTRNV